VPRDEAVPKILIVEDDELNRDSLRRLLRRRGFEIVLAVDGEDAVRAALAEAPDLIVMDMSLPIVDGWEATRRIKADPGVQATPIIALTAHAMSTDRDKALAAGCDDFDTKPIDLDRLLPKILALLAASDA
jgi:CheY-like chemotaxis protein